jgi:pimeloyl-ACP methyl ester carboxylesterase
MRKLLAVWFGLGCLGLAVPSRAAPPTSGHIEVPADHHAPKAAPLLKLYYERGGTGKKPALLLHGGPGVAPPMLAILARSVPGKTALGLYDLVYVHQRGAGKSLLPDEEKLAHVTQHKHRYRMDQYIADLELVRKKTFGPNAKVTVIGASWGGFLGLGYAIKHPHRVEALILGSFEATGAVGAPFCANIDRNLIGAATEHGELQAALERFRKALAAKKIVWHRGQKDQRFLTQTEILDVALPFSMKARYQKLAALLSRLSQGDRAAQADFDKLDLSGLASAGGSPPGTATFCSELVHKRQLETAAATPVPALYAECGKASAVMLQLCSPFLAERPFDVERQLAGLKVPALIFAGRWDPVMPWEGTARTAAKLPRARFLLVEGGHTPFDEGGARLAKMIEELAAGR